MAPGVSQRRHQVIDDDGVCAPLCLRTLTRIVHHEWIEKRQIAEEHIRRAIRGERETLARQPLESAVCTEMNERVRSPAIGEPSIEGDVVMTRRQVRSVIGRLRINTEGAWRLYSQEDVAEPQPAEEVTVAIGVRLERRVGLKRQVARPHGLAAPEWSRHRWPIDRRRAPQLAHGFLEAGRLRQKPLQISAPRHLPRRSRTQRMPLVVTPGRKQRSHQRIGGFRQSSDLVALFAQGAKAEHQRGRGIQPDGTAHALGLATGVRQDHCDFLVAIALAAQRSEAASEISHPAHALRVGHITVTLLEGDGRRDHSPIALGQSDVHGGLHRAQSMRRRGPDLSGRPATDRLQPRHTEGTEAVLPRGPHFQ